MNNPPLFIDLSKQGEFQIDLYMEGCINFKEVYRHEDGTEEIAEPSENEDVANWVAAGRDTKA